MANRRRGVLVIFIPPSFLFHGFFDLQIVIADPAPGAGQHSPPRRASAAPAIPDPPAPAPARADRLPVEPDEPLVVTDWAAPPAAPAAGAPAWGAPAQRIEPSFDDTGPDAAGREAGRAAPLLRLASLDSDGAVRSADAAPMAPTGSGQTRGVAEAGFLQAADRAARWRQPRARLLLWAGVGLLALSAALQAALLGRDLLAAKVPATAPALRGLCAVLGCQVQALRRIEALTVESSALGRIDDAGLYRLSLALRNRADIALLAPAVELSLTNAQGQLLSRRVLRLPELGLAGPELAAGQAVTLQAVLAAGALRIDGYTVELFYP